MICYLSDRITISFFIFWTGQPYISCHFGCRLTPGVTDIWSGVYGYDVSFVLM